MILNILKSAGRYALELLAVVVILLSAAFLVLALIAPANAAGTTANLSWVHPTTRIDESPLPVAQIRETLIEWRRTAAGPLIGSLRVPAPATTASVPGLVCGDFVFVAYTVAVDAAQSGGSTPPTNYATAIVCVPKAPTGLSAN